MGLMRALTFSAIPALFAHDVAAQTFLISDGASWNTCGGTFYDSGGPSDDYDNNEDFTATICPSDGGGTGATTAVQFLSFEVEQNDELVIHDGTSTGAPILATGDDNNSLAGQTFTATGPTGCLTFEWTSNNPDEAEGWEAEVITGSDAGTSETLTVCSEQPAFLMLDALGGTPNLGGSWTGPGGPHGPQFDPATDPSGVYTYIVMEGTSCADVATLTISTVPGPDAGDDGTLQFCADNPPVDLINSLGGTPMSGGTWSGPGGAHDGSFDPATDEAGDFTYTVPGTAPCPNATATVAVVNSGPDAGTSANLSVCSVQPTIQLIDALGGTPDPGGTWTGPGGPHGPTYEPGTEPSGVYTYTVTAGTCVASATITITNNAGPDAGDNGTLQICDSNSPVNLINSLGGSPESGGVWSGPNGLHDGSFDPATDEAGNYTYTVAGIAPCPNASATVTVTISGPDAGTSANLSVCSGQPAVQLIDALGGTPDPGGTWTGPGGPHGPIYEPGTEPSGVYTYTVTAGTCVASATITITNNAGPDAGDNGTLQICDSNSPVNLINSLGGTPAAGGTWAGPNGPHDGSLNLATDAPGDYTYTVSGIAPCPNASATVTVVISGPDAGTSANLSVCNGQSTVQLIAALGGTPDPGGSWTGPGGAHGPTYDPGSEPGGAYTYTVSTGTCAASATVTITNNAGPNAGDDGSLQICDSSPPVNLINSLGGLPASGGTWSGPNGAHDGSFDPTMDEVGDYTYTVEGIAPCPNVSATVTVVISGPDAGTNVNLSVCNSQAPVQLFNALGGSPDAGGSWIGPGGSHGPVYDPGTDPEGAYTYTVSVGGCVASAAVTINNVPAPDAGEDAQLPICATSSSVNLFISLEGTPQSGGSWTGPGGSHDGSFDPTTDDAGDYTYTVIGSAPCPNASATVTVVISDPDAGINANVSVCSGQAPFPLVDALGGDPDVGGSWAGPGGPHGPQYDPGSDPGGVYTYTVMNGSCVASATLNITNLPGPDAGDNATLLICGLGQPVNLFTSLEGTPESGGTWTGPGGAHDGSYDPTTDAPGPYTYTVAGTAPCASATATVSVVITGPDAGNSSSLTLCSGQPAFPLFDVLDGSPDVGGSWTGPGGPHGAVYDPGTDPGGVFTYTVMDGSSCTDTATVTINNLPGPDAGNDGTLLICSQSPPVALLNSLNGSPEGGGMWTGPSGAHDGSYDPASDIPGDYTYTVAGTSPCPFDTATVTVVLTGLPDAGFDGDLLACDTTSALDLFAGLGGTPDTAGTWLDLDGSGGLLTGTLNANGLPFGEYHFLYTVTVTGCGSDTALVTVRLAGNVQVEGLTRQCDEAGGNSVITFTISGGDADTYTVAGVPGTIANSEPFLFTSFQLPDTAQYTIVVYDQYGCGPAYLMVAPCAYEPQIFVPESFSPNGDGINETFEIPGLEDFPGNEIHIFNRWGAKLFEAKDYHRTMGWDGGGTGNAWLSGPLPTGTYYYVLDLGSSAKSIRGFIYLNR